jgi:c-di-GMP phosphodiesterase
MPRAIRADRRRMLQTARFSRAPQAGAAPVAVSRQPILDLCERVVAFELLAPPAADPRRAPAGVLAQAIADIGLSRLVGERPAHVDVTRDFLLSVRALPFAPEHVVLEVDAGRPADDLLLMALRDARDSGFAIALDRFDPEAGAEALLDLATSAKIDVSNLSGERLDAAIEAARGRGLALVACGVETRREYEICHELGFDAFQGHYFAEPAIVNAAPVPTYRLRALSMLAAREATSFEQIERVILEDPGLSLKLVKLANSAYHGGRHRVGTVRQALMSLGSVAVRRWAALFTLAGMTDRPTHLLELGLLRARLCELVAARTAGADPERAFTVGLFSVADSLLGARMSTLLDELPFDERTAVALAEHAGPEGRLLAGVLAYETGDFDGCVGHGVRLVDLALAYGEALDWTDGTLVSLAR